MTVSCVYAASSASAAERSSSGVGRASEGGEEWFCPPFANETTESREQTMQAQEDTVSQSHTHAYSTRALVTHLRYRAGL